MKQNRITRLLRPRFKPAAVAYFNKLRKEIDEQLEIIDAQIKTDAGLTGVREWSNNIMRLHVDQDDATLDLGAQFPFNALETEEFEAVPSEDTLERIRKADARMKAMENPEELSTEDIFRLVDDGRNILPDDGIPF